MDNFSVFNSDNLASAIEPFMPGATEHIVPVAYRAWTPDIFLFTFRLTVNGEDHFFASVIFDHLKKGQETAVEILQKWNNLKSDGFLYPSADSSAKVDPDDGGVWLDEVYKTYLVGLEWPKDLGYWSRSVVVTKETDLSDKSLGLSANAIKGVKDLLSKNEDYIISVYEDEVGDTEFFYNVR